MPGARAVALAVVLVAALAGCGTVGPGGATPAQTEVPSPFAACPLAAAAPSDAPTEAPADALPPVTLPCFADGAPVTLRWLGRPAVVNLWASYCGPCRTELPELQRYADETPGVAVIGVATGDQRAAAAWAGQDLGVRFPSLEDPQRRLLSALGRNALPLTLFVDADGVVRHQDATGALTLTKLRSLASRYLDVP
jgi:thiol-disulfide isomerase/thioredoxin